MGRININIPEDSRQWLFANRSDDHVCLWSLGRFPPPCEIGDTIVFRFDGKAVARAVVHEITPRRSCPNCGCRFEDRTYWEEVTP